MKLKDFLMVCGDTDMTITDTQDKTLCSGSSPHKELAKYENWDIVDITTNGYEKIFVMIEKSKESKESYESKWGFIDDDMTFVEIPDNIRKHIEEREKYLHNQMRRLAQKKDKKINQLTVANFGLSRTLDSLMEKYNQDTSVVSDIWDLCDKSVEETILVEKALELACQRIYELNFPSASTKEQESNHDILINDFKTKAKEILENG